jgi:pimeloyl-ACP methyl ester carboxylesterase
MTGAVALGLAGLAGFVALAWAGALGYRALCQRRTRRALLIGPDGIDESGYVRIGGMDQWIQIRGEDRRNPVLLFLHGAGMSMIPFTPLFRDWEKHFTVVQWDRRGTGRTRRRAGRERLTFDLMAQDGVEVAEYLRGRLGADPIILLGHSQGSIVGVMMAQRRPDLFRAYVGTGQITDMPRNEPATYRLAVERARTKANTRALRKLQDLGAPPYPRSQTWIAKQRWSFATDPELQAWSKQAPRLVLTAPGLTPRDIYLFNAGIMSYPQPLYEETMSWSAWAYGSRFAIPVYLLHGAADEHTLTSLVREYFAAIEAPAKELILLPGGGHCAVLAQPAAFLAELRALQMGSIVG